MKLGISLPTVGPAGDRDFILQTAVAADRLGFSSVWISSHVALPKRRVTACSYPRATTESAYGWGVPWLDPIAVMGVVAGQTETVEIGTHVLALPYRHPVILANELAALDHLSDGRIILGVGTGWMEEEFAAVGVSPKERGSRTNEYIKVLRTLWSSEKPTSFSGKYVTFEDIWLASRPARKGGPPIFVGGNSPAAIRRVGRLGDGWLGHEVYHDEVPRLRELLHETATKERRDPDSIVLSVRRGLLPPFEVTDFLSDRACIQGDADEVAEAIARYESAGVSLLVLDLSMLPREMVATMEWLAEEVVPRL